MRVWGYRVGHGILRRLVHSEREETVARRQRQRTERTRLALLSAARTLFKQQGYAGTTVAEITRAAGRAHGTFYLYFDSKHDLFTALLAGMGETIVSHARDLWTEESTIDAIWLGVRDFFFGADQNRDLWRLLEEMAAVDEAAAQLRTRLRGSFASRIRRGLELGTGSGRVDLEPAVLADLLTAMAFRFARTGHLPASPDVLALHVTVIWARGIGLPESELDALCERVAAV